MTTDRRDDPANHTGRVAADGGADGAAETPIDPEIVESVATNEDVPREALVDALVVLNASLIGQHSTYEEEYDYVTVEGVRAYVVDTGAWETLRTEHDLDSRLAAAAQHAHTEQTQRMLAEAADDPADERATGDIDAGIVIGIDTAEVMN